MARTHRLFAQYPLNGSATISIGAVHTPYHIYDGLGAFIGGTADLSAVQDLLKNETVVPLKAARGLTWMGVWICNFTDASLGPHHELQFSFFVGDGVNHASESSHPLALLDVMTRPEARMLCHGLWNNTPSVVAYNREMLSLNARLADSHIGFDTGTLAFKFQDQSSRQPLLAGSLSNLERPSWRATWDAYGQIGFKRMWTLARQPWMRLRILNPIGVGLNRNAVADSFTKNDVTLIRYFNDRGDTLEFGDTPYGALNFNPQFAQFMKGFKFVYLQPK